MPGMKVTVSAAMRARDVSRPQPRHEAAAEEAAAAARPAPASRARTAPLTTKPEMPHIAGYCPETVEAAVDAPLARNASLRATISL